MNVHLGDRLSAGALFSGIGGFCMGFQRAGVRTSWAVDADPYAVATYTANFPGVSAVSTHETDWVG
jgi:DNA (cytosine-5)-methyltransferase 1